MKLLLFTQLLANVVAAANTKDEVFWERELKDANSGKYLYRNDYLAVYEPDNFVSLNPDGETSKNLIPTEAPSSEPSQSNEPSFSSKPPPGRISSDDVKAGESIVQFGSVYSKHSIEFVNTENFDTSELAKRFKPNFGPETLPPEASNRSVVGGRQPINVPPGDPGYFLHGECVQNRPSVQVASTATTPPPIQARLLSHTCLLNLCLGGGGYDCIGIYAGTAFDFSIEFSKSNGPLSLPPPYPATIIGGTGAFEGIEGSAQVVTICGTTGLIQTGATVAPSVGQKLIGPFGFIVQAISVKANKPLPSAP